MKLLLLVLAGASALFGFLNLDRPELGGALFGSAVFTGTFAAVLDRLDKIHQALATPPPVAPVPSSASTAGPVDVEEAKRAMQAALQR